VPATFLADVKPVFELYPVDLMLLWMHRSGRAARLGLIEMARGSNCHIVEVHGSAAGDTSQRIAQRRFEINQAGCQYTAVLLGAIMDGGKLTRWLTHDEISAAVIEAIKTKRDVIAGAV